MNTLLAIAVALGLIGLLCSITTIIILVIQAIKKRTTGSSDEPLDTVGWGPFALPGERKRLRKAEKRRLNEMEQRKH